MEAPTLESIGQAVEELRTEFKSSRPDQEKIDRLNLFLDTAEEKINQPLILAQELAKNNAAEIAELKESLEKAGTQAGEARTRVEELELTIARRSVGSGADAKAFWLESEECKALNSWTRKSENELGEELKILRTDSATAGGILVPTELSNEIIKRIVEIDPIRSIARVMTIASKMMEMPIRTTIPVAQYEGETEEGPLSESSYDSVSVTPFRQTHTTPITQDQLMDAGFDMEAEIFDDSAQAFAFGEGNGFVVGSGFKQPSGFITDPTLQANARVTAAAGVLDPNSIILLTGDLKTGYNPTYVLNRRTLALIRTFRGDAASPGDQAGQYLWQPGLNGPVSNTLNGFPYVLANSVPDVAADAFAIAFGDFRRGYTIVDRTGMSVVRDEVTQKRKAIVEFTMNRWNTGRVVLTEAIKLLQIAS